MTERHDRDERVSLHGLDPEEALRALLAVKPDDERVTERAERQVFERVDGAGVGWPSWPRQLAPGALAGSCWLVQLDLGRDATGGFEDCSRTLAVRHLGADNSLLLGARAERRCLGHAENGTDSQGRRQHRIVPGETLTEHYASDEHRTTPTLDYDGEIER